MNTKKILSKVKFDKKGLIPAVIQDYRDKTVLMVAYMNREALRKTLLNRNTWFWSRKRKQLWEKGAESGNKQMVKKIFIDCDNDCLVIKVKQLNNIACHTGHKSCFYRQLL